MKQNFLTSLPASEDIPGGVPDVSGLTADQLDALLEHAVAAQKQIWDSLAADDSPATFDNTITVLESAEAETHAAFSAYYTYESSLGTPEVLAVAERWAPRLAEHSSAAARNPRIAARIADIPSGGLTDEQTFLLDLWRRRFEAAGAFVPAERLEDLAAIEAELATLEAEYSSSLIAGATAAAFITSERERLAGLSEQAVARAAAAAAEAGHEGSYLLKPDLFCAPALLSSMTDPAGRRAYYANSVNRGRGPVRDAGSTETPENLSIAARIAALRIQRAEIFGARTHAELTLRTSVAGSVDRVLRLIEPLAPRALENFGRELDVMAETAGVPRGEIQAADVPALIARVARERYSVDEEALRPYFELDRVLTDGVFRASTALFGITFEERTDLPGIVPEARTWVVREEDGRHLGVFVGDFFARDTKQGGAWMHNIVAQNGMNGTRPVIYNTLNISRPAEGQPVLLSLDNLRTLFHEFGHALHGLLTRTGYVTNSGTSVPRDFVEYPSQVNEMWMFAPGVVEHYAVHVETGEPLPAETIEALRASSLWGEGFRTSEYLGAALLDMAWHTRTSDDEPIVTAADALFFEESVLARYGFDAYPISPRYRTGNFKHIFGGGYSAGYYSYIFSELMDAETVQWFQEQGGLSREAGEVFRRRLLETGSRQDPAQSFRDLIGRDPEPAPLLARRGLS